MLNSFFGAAQAAVEATEQAPISRAVSSDVMRVDAKRFMCHPRRFAIELKSDQTEDGRDSSDANTGHRGRPGFYPAVHLRGCLPHGRQLSDQTLRLHHGAGTLATNSIPAEAILMPAKKSTLPGARPN